MQELFAVALFAVVLALIALEVLNRTVAALLGAAILISFGVLDQEQAATEFVDWNTIGLLAGMMVIVAILERTGVFEYLAIKSAQWGQARPGRILILLSVVTAFLSAFLDNVTTVILMVPVTFLIADALESSPMPFLLTQVMASNIGGAAALLGGPRQLPLGGAASPPTPFLLTEGWASHVGGAPTLISDPPNLPIGSAADLSFVDFVVALPP